MIAASAIERRTLHERGLTAGTVWHTLWVPVRVLAAIAAIAALAAVVASARAQSSASAKASAAVLTGDLGRVAPVRASGNDGASRSIPAKLPDGVVLGDGFVSATTSTSSLSASAQAEADDVELLGGVVTASLVQRSATDKGNGVSYRGSVLGLTVGEKEIDKVSTRKTYKFDGGTVTANDDGAGLVIELTDDVEGVPAGARIVVVDVSATATKGAPPTPPPPPTPTAHPRAAPPPRADRHGHAQGHRHTHLDGHAQAIHEEEEAHVADPADERPLHLPGGGQDAHRRPVRLPPRGHPRPPGQRPL